MFLPFPLWGSCLYTHLCARVGAPLFIRWDIDGDIHSFFVTLRRWTDGCPFNGRKRGKCFVTAQGRTRVTLLVLSRRPSLGWRAWRYYSSLILIVDDIGGLVGPINCFLYVLVNNVLMKSDLYVSTKSMNYITYIYIWRLVFLSLRIV